MYILEEITVINSKKLNLLVLVCLLENSLENCIVVLELENTKV